MKIKQLKIIKQSLEIILGMLLFLISYFLEGGLLHQQQSFHQPVGQLPGGLTPVVHHLHIFQPQLTCLIFVLYFLLVDPQLFLVEVDLVKYFVYEPECSLQVEYPVVIDILGFHYFYPF